MVMKREKRGVIVKMMVIVKIEKRIWYLKGMKKEKWW